MIYLCRFHGFRYLILGVLSSFLILVSGSCSNTPSSNADSVFTVATSPAFPPFEFKAEDGTLQGFDIDLMTAIAQTQNLTLEFQPMSYEEVIRSLMSNQVDAAISGISITPERAEMVSFSRPYFESGLAIAVHQSNQDVTSIDSLAGKRIAVQSGTTAADKAAAIPGAQVQKFNSAPRALQELVDGNVDAVINDAPVTLYAIRSGDVPSLKVTGELLTEEFYGIAAPKESENMALINDGLNTILENGTYAELYEAWFGQAPPELPEEAPEL